MVEFLLFCIATVGMTSIITQGVIFQPFRQFIGHWAERIRVLREQKIQERQGVTPPVSRRSFIEWFDELINCAQCTGFWCGLFCGLFLLFPEISTAANETFPTLPLLYLLLKWFCCGVGGSFLASFGCNAVEWSFYHKMNALRHLEEQDLILAARRTELQESETHG